MADKPGYLTSLRIKRVALVDSGANFDRATGDGAHIMLWKRATKDPDPVPITEETPVKKSFVQKLLGMFAETDVTKRAAIAADIEKEFPPDEDDSKPVHKADDAMCKCADCVSKHATAKSADVIAMEKRQETLEKANADLQKRLDTQIEKSEKDEIRTVLKSFTKVAVNLEKDADVDVFYAMRKASPAAYDRTIAMMKANDAQLAKAASFENIGSNRVGEGSAWAQIVAKAEALITKSTGAKMTKEQALDEVMQDTANFGLVKQYRLESASNQ